MCISAAHTFKLRDEDGHAYVGEGGDFRVPIVFDNLIHQGAMPVTIGIFIDPGHLKDELPTETGGTPAHYRVVFMDRDLEEVLASQKTMLDHQGRQGANLERDRLAEIFKEQLQKVHRSIDERDISCLVVRHADAIQNPQGVAESVNEFFDGSLDASAMAAVVDPTLYRERARE